MYGYWGDFLALLVLNWREHYKLKSSKYICKKHCRWWCVQFCCYRYHYQERQEMVVKYLIASCLLIHPSKKLRNTTLIDYMNLFMGLYLWCKVSFESLVICLWNIIDQSRVVLLFFEGCSYPLIHTRVVKQGCQPIYNQCSFPSAWNAVPIHRTCTSRKQCKDAQLQIHVWFFHGRR